MSQALLELLWTKSSSERNLLMYNSKKSKNSKKWLMALLDGICVLQKERVVSLQKGVSDQCVKFKLM